MKGLAAALTFLLVTAAASDALPPPLTATPGDPVAGKKIVLDRHVGLCLLCHSGPVPEERFQGNLAPDLAGAGARWNAAQLRLRLVNPQHFNPDSLMPAYYRTDGLVRVSERWQGRPILDAQQIEDVIAWLLTLKN